MLRSPSRARTNKRRVSGVIQLQDLLLAANCRGLGSGALDYRGIGWLLAAARPCSVGRLLMRGACPSNRAIARTRRHRCR